MHDKDNMKMSDYERNVRTNSVNAVPCKLPRVSMHSHLLTLEFIQLMPNSRLNPQQDPISSCLTDAWPNSTTIPTKFNTTVIVNESVSTHTYMFAICTCFIAAKAHSLNSSYLQGTLLTTASVIYHSRHYGTKLTYSVTTCACRNIIHASLINSFSCPTVVWVRPRHLRLADHAVKVKVKVVNLYSASSQTRL